MLISRSLGDNGMLQYILGYFIPVNKIIKLVSSFRYKLCCIYIFPGVVIWIKTCLCELNIIAFVEKHVKEMSTFFSRY